MGKLITSLIFVLILFHWFKNPSYATLCFPTYKSDSNLVVAEFVSYETICTEQQWGNTVYKQGHVIMYFKNIRNVIGDTPLNFSLIPPAEDKCSLQNDTESERVKVYRIFGDPATIMQKGSIYLLSVELNKDGEYIIGGCGSIIQEVTSKSDPLVTSTKFKIITNNILLSGFSFAEFINERLSPESPPPIFSVLFLISVLLYYGFTLFIFVKLFLFIIKKAKK